MAVSVAHQFLGGAQRAQALAQFGILGDGGEDFLALLVAEFVVDEGVQPFVGKIVFCIVHFTLLRRGCTAAGSSSPRRASRARHSRLITVPIGIASASATSA